MADTGNHRVQLYRADGTFAGKFGSEGVGDGQFLSPSAAAFSSDGLIAVVDHGGRVQAFHPNGTLAGGQGLPGGDGGPLDGLRSVSFAPPPPPEPEPEPDPIQPPPPEPEPDPIQPPPPDSVQPPQQEAVSRSGMIVVADSSNRRVQVFHPNGTFDYTFGVRHYDGFSSFNPYSVAVSPSGDRIAMSGGSDVLVVYPNGTFDYKLRVASSTETCPFYNVVAESVAYSPLGDRIAVTVHGYLGCLTTTVKVFYSNGTFDFEFGRLGSGDGQLDRPESVAYSPDGNYIAVADTNNNRIQLFHANGTYYDKFGSRSSRGSANGQFNEPDSLAYSPDGNYIAVDDANNYRIQLFHAANGTYHDKFGFGRWGSANGQFNGVGSLAYSPDGNYIAVAEHGNNRVQLFHANGTYYDKFGSRGTADGQFWNPYSVAYFP